jgi:hypothetical protein
MKPKGSIATPAFLRVSLRIERVCFELLTMFRLKLMPTGKISNERNTHRVKLLHSKRKCLLRMLEFRIGLSLGILLQI